MLRGLRRNQPHAVDVAGWVGPRGGDVEKQWLTEPGDAALAQGLASQTGLPLAACQVLVTRGFAEPGAVDAWLQPRLSRLTDPFLLPNMAAAAQRLAAAVQSQETVLVYGDYDVDGVTSTALIIRVLRALGVTAIPFLPHRVDDGYGLALEPVERCVKEHQPHCIVTVDCGTGSVEAVQRAKELGVDVIVTDHHEPGDEVAPAHAVVNPKLGAAEDPLRHLAGVGVAFKLCHAVLKLLRDEGHALAEQLDLRAHLDLVAVGTIADMVPLVEENRVLARYGLIELNRTRKPGLIALREVAGISGPMDAYHIGFLLGPRLNAAGRLGTAQKALDLMLIDDDGHPFAIAEELDAANKERQKLELTMIEQATAAIDAYFDPSQHFALVVGSREWHPGVIGIVASRLVNRYARPTVVIAIDEDGVGRGSCRSVSPFNMVEGLGDCADLLDRFGGHAMAAGLQLAEGQIAALRDRLNTAVSHRVSLEALRPKQRIDAWISLREADWPLIECLEKMAPFGLGNTKPIWGVRGAQLLGEPRVVGQKHLQLGILHDNTSLGAIAFNMADEEIPGGPLDIAFQLDRNSFRGRESIQLKVQAIRATNAEHNEGL